LHLCTGRLQPSIVMNHAILTAIGTDRPGIVDEVSQFIFDRGGNIEDSRMVNLRGQFAIMVLVGGGGAGVRVTCSTGSAASWRELRAAQRA
jgi:glycine cleavage system regulatory protein